VISHCFPYKKGGWGNSGPIKKQTNCGGRHETTTTHTHQQPNANQQMDVADYYDAMNPKKNVTVPSKDHQLPNPKPQHPYSKKNVHHQVARMRGCERAANQLTRHSGEDLAEQTQA